MTERRSLLSSKALIQSPWIKVTIGDYTFGVFSKLEKGQKNSQGFYSSYKIQYPNYIESLAIVKINGQVNQYTLSIKYPVRPQDDPNFFEKVFSSISKTRKILFSYGDASMPSYVYKDEEAIITKISTGFNFGSGGQMGSVISYTIQAVSSAALGQAGSFTFINSTLKKPSDEIKKIFRNKEYGLQSLFTGMSEKNLDELIAGDDKKVKLNSKTNISPIDYITYLVSCMVPGSSPTGMTSKDIYILTLNDDTVYDKSFNDTLSLGGPYFKVTRVSHAKAQTDAYEIDIGYNGATVVTNFQIQNNENYSLLYDYSNKLFPEEYARRLDDKGNWEEVFAPVIISGNDNHQALSEDIAWYTKLTQFPIKASITILGLLRPATLLTHLRINVIFPGGVGTSGERKHISSGLYMVIRQTDRISGQGYFTDLELVKISGDELD